MSGVESNVELRVGSLTHYEDGSRKPYPVIVNDKIEALQTKFLAFQEKVENRLLRLGEEVANLDERARLTLRHLEHTQKVVDRNEDRLIDFIDRFDELESAVKRARKSPTPELQK